MGLLPSYSAPKINLADLYFNTPAPTTISNKAPNLGDRLSSALRRVGVSDRQANRLGQKLVTAAEALTPLGNVTGAYQAGQDLRQGNWLSGGLGAALAVLPGAPKGMFGQRIVRAYHGGRGFEGEFDLAKVGSGLGRAEEPAVWFTPDRTEADRYAWNIPPAQTYNGKAVYPANIDTSGFHEATPGGYDPELFAQIIAEARRAKKPGVIFKNVTEHRLASPDQIAVLDPARIKF